MEILFHVLFTILLLKFNFTATEIFRISFYIPRVLFIQKTEIN